MRLFNASTTMMNIGEPVVRLMAVAWLLSIPNLVVSSALQGLSMGMPEHGTDNAQTGGLARTAGISASKHKGGNLDLECIFHF